MSQALLVGEYLSFRRVATVLGVRQSAVSRRVRELEDELGVSLFERHHAGVRITNAGVRFLQEARAALVQLDQAVKTATAAGSGTIGRISIGILSSIGTGYLRDLLQVYRSRHPEVGIHILESASADNIAAVRKRQLDVAFITDTSEANGCEILPLWSERIFVVLAEHHALCERQEIEWRDLRKQQLIMRESECDQALCDRLNRGLTDCDHGSDVQKLDVGRDTLMHLVAMGLGISLTTEATAATPFPKVVFRPIARNDELLQFSAAWLAHNDNPALRRFLSLARSLANEPRRHPGAALTSRGSAVIGGLSCPLLLPARSREGLVCLHEIGAHRIKSSATLSRSTTASTAATTRRHAHRQLDITGSAWTEAMRRDPIVWSLASLAETARMRGPLT